MKLSKHQKNKEINGKDSVGKQKNSYKKSRKLNNCNRNTKNQISFHIYCMVTLIL